jgi:hypothetical protein
MEIEFLVQNSGQDPSRGRISAFMLDIQTGISGVSDIEIKRFKSPNLSTRPGLQL